MIFETDRFIVRPYQMPEDLDAAMVMYGDPEVQRYLMGIVEADPEVVRDRLATRTEFFRQRGDGTGFWAVERKADGRVVGNAIAKHLPDGDGNLTEDLEIGWHVAREFWGQGYATEFGLASRDYAFEKLGVDEILIVMNPLNERSLRVALKVGATERGFTDRYYGMHVRLLSITREEWERLRSAP